LVRTDPALAENLLSRNPDDQFVVEMFRYFETAYMPDLLQRYASNPDPHVRNRARKLFKQYKNWNDITYQKLLEGQTNGTVANSN
jgi:hypothetical protein